MMTQPGEVPMPNATFEVEPTARSEHILALIGIEPDPRHFIPLEETREMVAGVKDQDHSAIHGLIAAKITSVYKHVQKSQEIAERHDLSLADVMHTGCLSITEAALIVNTESPVINSLLRTEIMRELGRQLTGGRLVPAIGKQGQRVEGTANGAECRIADPIVLVEGEDELSESAVATGEAGIEYTLMLRDARTRLLKHLPDREKYILERRFGLTNIPVLTQEELSAELCLAKSRIGQIIDGALRQIRIGHGTVRPLGSYEYDGIVPEEFYETWLPSS